HSTRPEGPVEASVGVVSGQSEVRSTINAWRPAANHDLAIRLQQQSLAQIPPIPEVRRHLTTRPECRIQAAIGIVPDHPEIEVKDTTRSRRDRGPSGHYNLPIGLDRYSLSLIFHPEEIGRDLAP